MRLLLDTNIFLEVLLDQENAQTVRALFYKNEFHDLNISDFTFHSIGLLLFRRKQHDAFHLFVKDMIFTAGVKILALPPEDAGSVIEAAQKFGLDFDDAYQYALASKQELQLVSFDKDFDRTALARKVPADF